jgi:hypothetical protein
MGACESERALTKNRRGVGCEAGEGRGESTKKKRLISAQAFSIEPNRRAEQGSKRREHGGALGDAGEAA